MFRVTKLATAILAGALVLTACGGDDDTTEPKASGSESAPKSDLKVGLAYDIGGRGDQSFNDAAAAGLEKAKSELGVNANEARRPQASPSRPRRSGCACWRRTASTRSSRSASPTPMRRARWPRSYPDTQFAIIDDAGASRAEHRQPHLRRAEGSFLVGAAAALKTKTGTSASSVASTSPLIQKFEAGYAAGAKAVNPDIKVAINYLTQPPDFTGFNDPAKGKETRPRACTRAAPT